MSKVMLPYVEPMYSTYHWLASAGIPAKQNCTSDNWYYNNTIEWCCTNKFLNGFTSPEINVESGNIWHLSFLENIRVNTRFTYRCVLDVIKTMLDEGYYIDFCGADDYYIKGKSWYKQRHFDHDGLIIGYDDEKKTLTLAAYDQRWLFNVFETPQVGFVKAMQVLCNKGSYGSLHALRAKKDVLELDLKNILNKLKNYLSSCIDKYPLSTSETVWGMVVYEYICLYVDKLMDGSIPHERIDRRVFRLIWEHKKCMLGRIKAVENLCGWDNKLSSDYEEIVKMADKMRFIYSKFVIKYSSKHLEKMQLLLMDIKRSELDLLTKFLLKLEEVLKDGEHCS